MPRRACIICPAPAIAGLSRCSKHRRGGSPGPSPYDANHQRLAKEAIERALRAGTPCPECGRPLTERGPRARGPYDPPQGDHIVSLSEGGRSVANNYRATHRSCNISKGGANRRG